MSGPFVLAVSAGEPDREFPSLVALARAVLDHRDALPGRPEIHLQQCTVGRCALPNGSAVAVRLRDGSNEGRGSLFGYAFLPTRPGGHEAEQLMNLMLGLMEARVA